MGLDLVVEACARPGFEAEWRSLLARSFADEPFDENATARFRAISIPPYERLGAPRVGTDAAADAWIIERSGLKSDEEIARLLDEHQGFYVLSLVKSDGLPDYTHAGLYDGLDETSFRGSFLIECVDVLTRRQIDEAWNHRMPENAISFGRTLLDAVAEKAGIEEVAPQPRGIIARFFVKNEKSSDFSLDDQRAIVDAAGRWFSFWGERGHAIRAWF